MRRRTGDNWEEGTPVPIPNTAVKLFSPDDTLGVAPRENRTSPFHPPTQAVFCWVLAILQHKRFLFRWRECPARIEGAEIDRMLIERWWETKPPVFNVSSDNCLYQPSGNWCLH